jgi:hypothetical protein
VRFLADECVSRQIITALREERHDVLWMKDVQPGESDVEVLARSHLESRILRQKTKVSGDWRSASRNQRME